MECIYVMCVYVCMYGHVCKLMYVLCKAREVFEFRVKVVFRDVW